MNDIVCTSSPMGRHRYRTCETTSASRKARPRPPGKMYEPELAPRSPRRRLGVGLSNALRRPSEGLDVGRLSEMSSRLGLSEEKTHELVYFANLLAEQNLLSRVEEFARKSERMAEGWIEAEARYGRAEARFGQAEARASEALRQALHAEKKVSRIERLAHQRYLMLAELRGSVNLRDALKGALGEGSEGLVVQRKNSRQARPSTLEKWVYIFEEASRQEFPDGEASLMDCCRAANDRVSSPEKAAAAMVRITENLDQRVHRSLPPDVVRRIGGIAIEESALLGTQACKLIECVLTWAMVPCRIVSREEIDSILEQKVQDPFPQGQGG